MARRWVRVLVVFVVAGAVLSGCSVPAEWAIRLNADRTVDYLSCWGELDSISVDYWRSYQDEPEVVEWEAETVATPATDFSLVSKPLDVAYYGELPPNWDGAPALPPPVGWDWVDVGAGPSIARDELVAGVWHWQLNTTWPWIPEHPCDGWIVDAHGEPRRLP